MRNDRMISCGLAALAAAVLALPGIVLAHCDTMDGPVVKAAVKALETGDVRFVLVWVKPGDDKEIRKAFQKTVAVRKGSPEARELADMYFFETLVRLHRAGEGAPYAGLRPAGSKPSPAAAAVDMALQSGQSDEIFKLLADAYQKQLTELFKRANSKKGYKPANVEAGRQYVRAYVELMHYVEGLHAAARAPVKGISAGH